MHFAGDLQDQNLPEERNAVQRQLHQ